LVVHKPQGIETTGVGNTLEKLVGASAVHRLDTNTEGLVIFAKNNASKLGLEMAFKNGLVKKTYQALTFGAPKTSPMMLTGFLSKDSNQGFVKITKSPHGANALSVKTHVRTLEKRTTPVQPPAKPIDIYLLEVQPITGRTHQIRAHLGTIGVSIVGDGKYGDFKLNRASGYKRQCLCAVGLEFAFEKGAHLAYLNKKKFTTEPTCF